MPIQRWPPGACGDNEAMILVYTGWDFGGTCCQGKGTVCDTDDSSSSFPECVEDCSMCLEDGDLECMDDCSVEDAATACSYCESYGKDMSGFAVCNSGDSASYSY